MADLADVETALVAAVLGAIYPNGTSAPSAITLANGSNPTARVFAGWPLPANLDADLLAGVVNVSVFPQAGMERNTTRYPLDWVDQSVVTPTITALVSGSSVTFGGTITAGNYVTALCSGQAWSYLVQASDTLSSVAAALAALISPSFYASATGPALTIGLNAGYYDEQSDYNIDFANSPVATGLTIRIGAPRPVIRELERVNQRFMISVFAPSHDARQATARLIRPAFAQTNFLTLADTSAGRLVFENSQEIDEGERQNVFRRSLFYWVEYPTTSVTLGYPITVPQMQVTANGVSALTQNS